MKDGNWLGLGTPKYHPEYRKVTPDLTELRIHHVIWDASSDSQFIPLHCLSFGIKLHCLLLDMISREVIALASAKFGKPPDRTFQYGTAGVCPAQSLSPRVSLD